VDFHLLGALDFAACSRLMSELIFQAKARLPLGSGIGHDASRAEAVES